MAKKIETDIIYSDTMPCMARYHTSRREYNEVLRFMQDYQYGSSRIRWGCEGVFVGPTPTISIIRASICLMASMASTSTAFTAIARMVGTLRAVCTVSKYRKFPLALGWPCRKLKHNARRW